MDWPKKKCFFVHPSVFKRFVRAYRKRDVREKNDPTNVSRISAEARTRR